MSNRSIAKRFKDNVLRPIAKELGMTTPEVKWWTGPSKKEYRIMVNRLVKAGVISAKCGRRLDEQT